MIFDQNTIVYILEIIVGGLLVGIGVHFVPVGGAPAAMAQATGIGTGTVQLAAGSGLTGLLAAGLMMSVTDNLWLILASGAVGAGIMMGSTMLTGSWIYAYAVGAPFASAKVNYDPITGFSQPPYVAPGTVGQGIPTVCFVSGLIGGMNAALSAMFAIGIFLVNAVIASWNIQGTIEGFHDPKFKKWPFAFRACAIASILLALASVLITGGA